MGLVPVEDTVPLHIPATVVCTEGSSSTSLEDGISFDNTIYRTFSMRSDMKTLTYPATIKSEFDMYIKYAEEKTAGTVNTTLDHVDNYLGSIGVTNGIC